eukprot:755796-Hanusia_phi.AAC.4
MKPARTCLKMLRMSFSSKKFPPRLARNQASDFRRSTLHLPHRLCNIMVSLIESEAGRVVGAEQDLEQEVSGRSRRRSMAEMRRRRQQACLDPLLLMAAKRTSKDLSFPQGIPGLVQCLISQLHPL